MAYIGNTVQTIPFITDTFSGDSSTVSFSLTRAPASTASIAVFVGGSYQRPGTYTLSGSVLTFGSAPTTGTSNIVVLHLGNGQQVQVPSDGSVTLIRLASDTYGYINAAFTQANTPSSTANSAASYANAAFTTANTSIASGSYANSAFGAANTASATGTAAGSYANSGFAVANSAASYANSSFLKANTPSYTANSAASYANAAFAQANTDYTTITFTAGTYGNATVIPALTIAANGRITGVSNTAVSGVDAHPFIFTALGS